MKLRRLTGFVVCALLGAACDPSSAWWWQVHHGGGSTPLDDDSGVDESVLTTLPLSEAPAPSDWFSALTLYWGTLEVTAPGFAGPPRDELTLALDANYHPRYLSWKTLPAFPKTFGDAEGEFPLTGSRHVAPIGYGVAFQATVLDAPQPTADHFLLRTQLVSDDGISDYIESVEGWTRAGGWDIRYTERGLYFGASIDAIGTGLVTHGPGGAPTNDWAAPVEVVSPGFTGEPIDHLTLSRSDDGQLRSFDFENFVRSNVTFGTGADDLPVSGTLSRGDLSVTVDPAIAPSREHFVLRYHVIEPSRLNDFTEGIEGTQAGDTLHIRYFIEGTLWGASIHAHAAGTLLP
jgi:hypothetical protein